MSKYFKVNEAYHGYLLIHVYLWSNPSMPFKMIEKFIALLCYLNPLSHTLNKKFVVYRVQVS